MTKKLECPKCHSLVEEDKQFCGNCGEKLIIRDNEFLRKTTRVKVIYDKNDVNLTRLCEVRENESNEIVEVVFKRNKLFVKYPKIILSKKDYLLVEEDKIWLNFTKKELNEKLEKARLAMIQKQQHARSKKFRMILWNHLHEV